MWVLIGMHFDCQLLVSLLDLSARGVLFYSQYVVIVFLPGQALNDSGIILCVVSLLLLRFHIRSRASLPRLVIRLLLPARTTVLDVEFTKLQKLFCFVSLMNT